MDEDFGKNEMVSAFMDSTGNHDVANAMRWLEQFDWNINDAVIAALSEESKNDINSVASDTNDVGPITPDISFNLNNMPSFPADVSTSIGTLATASSSTAPSSNSIPVLMFQVRIPSVNGECDDSEHIRVPQTDTINDVKRLIVERSASQLLLLLTSIRTDSLVPPFEKYFYLDGLFNNRQKFRNLHQTITDSTVLKTLPLPKENCVTMVPLKENETLDTYYKDLKKVLRPPLHHSMGQIKRDVASLTGVIRSRQKYAISDLASAECPSEQSSCTNALCNALNEDNSSKTLQQIGVQPGMRFFFEEPNSRPNSSHQVVDVDDEDDYEYSDEDDYANTYDSRRSSFDDAGISIDTDPRNSSFLTSGIRSNLIDVDTCTGDPRRAIQVFSSRFRERYTQTNGTSMIPDFMLASFDEAIQQTLSQSRVSARKPLLIYLHNDRSISSHLFCQLVMTHEAFKRFLDNQQLSLWPWDVTLPCARERLRGWFSARLNSRITDHVFHLPENSFPLILFLGKLNGQVEVLAKTEGDGKITTWPLFGHSPDDFDLHFPPVLANMPIMREIDSDLLSADAVAAQLIQVYLDYQERLQPELEAEFERTERERILAEQRAAYEESLRQDQLKMEAKNRAAREEQERLRAEQEAEQKALKEAQDLRERKAAQVPNQPPDPKSEEGKQFLQTNPEKRGIACLRFRLPGESKPSQTRRFVGSHSLDQLLNFVESLGYSRDMYKILTTFPRRDISNVEFGTQLADLGLVPEETLIIEER
ncbi:pre-rRNA processing and 40S ribosomal subunit assembly [Cichlidogyrus casuarinus]|uniref:Pre-rRNA processing and 40S ribosomal subunit assembly n=1 Tax=Cichlidogyrus casuarinus TaxID=1844966 RepID=A0ABD2QM64_9PLAT